MASALWKLSDSESDGEVSHGLAIANHWISTGDQSRCDEKTTADLVGNLVPLTSPPLSATYLDADSNHEQTGHVEMYVDNTWLIIFYDLERVPCEGEVVRLRIFLSTGTRKAVIERDTVDLTKEELVFHRDLVGTAIANELKTWQHYKCFSRRPHAQAKNVIGC